MIFIFPKGGHTDWNKVREVVNKWNPAPLLIYENIPGPNADAFDGFYAWVQPGDKGWAADGSNWGEQYLSEFLSTMESKYPDKIIVGGAWAQLRRQQGVVGPEPAYFRALRADLQRHLQSLAQILPCRRALPFS